MTITWNNIRRIFKSKGLLIVMFVLPMVFITLFMASSFVGSQIRVGIVDMDQTAYSKILIDFVSEKNNVVKLDENEIQKKLIDGKLNYALKIEAGFTDKLIRGEDVKLVGFGLQETNIALPAKFSIESFLNSSKNLAIASKGDQTKFYDGLKRYTNAGFAATYKQVNSEKSRGMNTVISLGFLIMSMIFLSNSSAQFILDDKKNKTFFRIFASPISTRSYMLQNILSFFLILGIQLSVIFTIMKFGFKAYFGPSILSVFLLFLVFSTVCVSLGVAIASISKDSRQAGAISTFVTVPMCMLGGCFWERTMMPEVLQKIGEFMPTTWVLRASQELVMGGSLSSIWIELGILLLFTLVFVLLGSWKKIDIAN